ncbi:hypothetical protein CHARACLAT_020289, partial [Characodon lateralis]|nr:hypothetical protein [Characodon lateralis]
MDMGQMDRFMDESVTIASRRAAVLHPDTILSLSFSAYCNTYEDLSLNRDPSGILGGIFSSRHSCEFIKGDQLSHGHWIKHLASALLVPLL